MRAPKKHWSQVKYAETRFGGGQTKTGVSFPGGLDQTTPILSLQAGALRAAQNFECAQSGGYSLIGGYERFDGRARPSDASFTIVQFASFGGAPAVGDSLTQAVSGAAAVVCWVNTNVGGVYWLGVTQVTGVFDTTHAVTDTTQAFTVGTPIPLTANVSAKTRAQIQAGAADIYRALIGAVPGSGRIVDTFLLPKSGIDTLYALRANVGNTALALYKSSGSGWTLVPFFNTIQFTAGGASAPADGATLTQGGVTATVQRVMQSTGSWAGSTAAGQLVITNPGGGNFAAGAATLTGGASVTLSGVQTAIAPLPGGRGEHVRANFFSQPLTRRVYGVDGVNAPYEFDGVTYAPIIVPGATSAPDHVTFHKNYLVLSYQGSIVGSGPNLPYRYDAGAGAWEVGTGDTVTSIITLPGSQSTATLAVFQQGNTSFLYGLDVTTFNYVTFNTGIGALQHSAQNLYDVFVFDDVGVVTLQTTLNWGNFLPSALTRNIFPFVKQERSKITASSISMGKSQYRVFFSDGQGLYLTVVNRQYLGSIPVLFPNPVSCVDVCMDSLNNERAFFGSSGGLGFVYEMDVGTSFDGVALSAYITPNWNAVDSPRLNKHFRACSIELQATAYVEMQFGYSYNYGAADVGQILPMTLSGNFSLAPNWDNFTWDNFTWDGQTVGPTDADMNGDGFNVQPSFTVNSNYVAPFTIDSIIYHYSQRRGIRV